MLTGFDDKLATFWAVCPCCGQFVIKLLGHSTILTQHETACVERIVLCILQTVVSYAQVSSTGYGIFSNFNRHLVAHVKQGTLSSAPVYFVVDSLLGLEEKLTIRPQTSHDVP